MLYSPEEQKAAQASWQRPGPEDTSVWTVTAVSQREGRLPVGMGDRCVLLRLPHPFPLPSVQVQFTLACGSEQHAQAPNVDRSASHPAAPGPSQHRSLDGQCPTEGLRGTEGQCALVQRR